MDLNLPIYVINLAWATQRKNRIVSQLNKFNLSYELITARDGNFLSKYDNIRYGMYNPSPYLSRLLTAGEKGCAISHRGIYEMIIERGQEYALILEDDAIITQDAINFLYYIGNNKKLPLEWNLIYLGYYVHTLGEPFFMKSLYPISLWGNNKLDFMGDKNYHIGRFILRPRGAFGYLITRKAARIVLEYSTQNNAMMSDRYLSSSEIPGVFGVSPRLLYHNDEKVERCILGRPSSVPHYNIFIRILDRLETMLINKTPFISKLTRNLRLCTRRVRATLLLLISRGYARSSVDIDR